MKFTRREFIRDGVAAFTVGFAAPTFLSDLARAQGHLRGVDAAFAPASQAQGQDGSRAFLDDLEDRQGQRPDPPSPILLSMGRR